ncbi:uncharacterized protein LOC129600880 [Paramacrobiotus metropolitanus]|uniref:uncharacterized protein LOC129600880 n=1 Tax=Paramacrobiotus metropolitanus TaxID=2943436 RepID=UPI0024456CB7|nr:uncharacterized protein LOC129600880 [Paramacrobiotus metropolitanus]
MEEFKLVCNILDQASTGLSKQSRSILVYTTDVEILKLPLLINEQINKLDSALTNKFTARLLYKKLNGDILWLCEELEDATKSQASDRSVFIELCRSVNPLALLMATYEDVMDCLARVINSCEYPLFEQWCDYILLQPLNVFICMYACDILGEPSDAPAFDQRKLGIAADQILEIADALALAKIQSRAKIFEPQPTDTGDTESELQKYVMDFMKDIERGPGIGNEFYAHTLTSKLKKQYPWFVWAVVITDDGPPNHTSVTHSESFAEDLFFQRSMASNDFPSSEVVCSGKLFGVMVVKGKSRLRSNGRTVTVFWIREEEIAYLDRRLYETLQGTDIPQLIAETGLENLEQSSFKDLLQSHGFQSVVTLTAYPQRSHGKFGYCCRFDQDLNATWPVVIQNTSGHLILWPIGVDVLSENADSDVPMVSRFKRMSSESSTGTRRKQELSGMRKALTEDNLCVNSGLQRTDSTDLNAKQRPFSLPEQRSTAVASKEPSIPVVENSMAEVPSPLVHNNSVAINENKAVHEAVNPRSFSTPHFSDEKGQKPSLPPSSPVASKIVIHSTIIDSRHIIEFAEKEDVLGEVRRRHASKRFEESAASFHPTSTPALKKSLSAAPSQRHSLRRLIFQKMGRENIDNSLQRALRAKEKGNACFMQGNLDNAVEQYEKMQKLLKYYTGIEEQAEVQRRQLLAASHVNLAAVHLERYDLAAAKQSATKALGIDPDNVTALFKRGAACLGLTLYREAEQDFLQILRLSPQEPDVLLLLGLAQKGKKVRLRERFQEIGRRVLEAQLS